MNRKDGFGSRLREALDARRMSQNALADRLTALMDERTYASVVGGWVKGSMPGGDYMLFLPEALNVDGHWLLTGEGTMDRPTPTAAQEALSRLLRAADEAREMIKVPPTAFTPMPKPES